MIDTEAFAIASRTAESVRFRHAFELVNFSGTRYEVGIERTVTALGSPELTALLGGQVPDGLRFVGCETDNRITNIGRDAWRPETGLISIWMLGMYNPSPGTTVVIPFTPGSESELGAKGIAGSYDAAGQTLTIVTYHAQPAPHGFVKGSDARLDPVARRLLGVNLQKITLMFEPTADQLPHS